MLFSNKMIIKKVTMKDGVENVTFCPCIIVYNSFEILSLHESISIPDFSDIKRNSQFK